MKVLGYVNCYNRGISMVQEELEANGNGKAEFSFRLITAFKARWQLRPTRKVNRVQCLGNKKVA